jgi:hypothetical protein
MRTISLSMTAKGTFFKIESFVSNLERLTRAMRIDTFALSGQSPEPLNLSMTGKMFMASAPAPVAPVTGSATPQDTGATVVPEATTE